MSTARIPRDAPRLSTKPRPICGAPGGVSAYHDVEPSSSSALPGTPVAVARRYGSYTDAARASRSIAVGAAGAGVVPWPEPGVVCEPPPLAGGVGVGVEG